MSDVAAVVVLVAAFMMVCCGVLGLMPDPGISVHFRMLDDDTTALHVASMHGCYDAARLLLREGAALELRDVYGRTALHHAASGNQEQLIRLLVESGADRDAKDCQGRTPADVMLIPHACAIVPFTSSQISINHQLTWCTCHGYRDCCYVWLCLFDNLLS